MTHPKPDRSNYAPGQNGPHHHDIGWAEGTLSDGRPYRLEAWAEGLLTCNTYFVAAAGLETLTREAAADLLEREGLLTYLGSFRSAYVRPMQDAAGTQVLSINMVIADEDSGIAEDHVPLNPYLAADRG